MGRHSLVRNVSHERVANSSDNGRRKARITIATRHALLTDTWTRDVQALDTAIGRFEAKRPVTNACQVACFEIAGDGHLHVNVTHRYATTGVSGWAGPASLPEGFVHNRRFGGTPPNRIIRHVRDMVFAARI